MSGPSANFAKGWSMIRQKIKTDEPHAVTKCLGCEQSATRTWGVCRSNLWIRICDRFLNNVWIVIWRSLKIILILFNLPRHLSWMRPKLSSSENTEGLLAPIACKVFMKILYGTRLARFDLLRPIAALASKISKWDTVCDRMSHRLVCYINSSLDYRLRGHIGDRSKYLILTLYVVTQILLDAQMLRSPHQVYS